MFNPDAFPNFTAVQFKWAEVEKEQAEFVNGVTDQSLAILLPFRATQLSLNQLMQHVVNHSTYNRGQLALMLRQLDAEPLATDFHLFLVECHNEAAPCD
jgi:uncharacterized damage-inducible protein DinB